MLKHIAALVTCVTAATAFAATTTAPPELSALAAKAQIKEPLSRWCRGDFQAGTANSFAVAAPHPHGGGRYLVLGLTDAAIELAAYSGGADLACYSVEEARGLNDAIAGSETIHGGISPTLSTTVVCGFVNDTGAVCWQYSPTAGTFVKVGEWIT